MRYRTLRLAFVIAAAGIGRLSCAQTSTDPDTPRRFARDDARVALVVGVSDYDASSGLGSLKYTVKDARDMESALASLGYSVRLIDSGATKSRITTAIRDLAGAFQQGKQGTFVFSYSGHGLERDGQNYLVPFGVADSDIVKDGLRVADVEALMRDSGARQRLLLIDACRYATQSQSRSELPRPFAEMQAAEGELAIYASQSGQRSYEDDALRNGVFTHYLVRGLAGDAAGADGLISVIDLLHYLQPHVRDYSIAHGVAQYPHLAGSFNHDFVVGLRKIRREQNSIDGQWYEWIPPGKYIRGCSPGDDECMGIEKPAREVEITTGFWIGESETTVAAWRRYRARDHATETPQEDGFGRKLNEAAGNDSLPVVGVTWAEARDFCAWAKISLPTEAQWEYAARSGDRGPAYGDLSSIAWYGDNSGHAKIDSMQVFREQNQRFGELLYANGNGAHPVGMRQPNRNGLYDMLGNVWEWTSDWFGTGYYKDGPVVDPTGPLGGEKKVLRGGSWSTYPSGVRVSARDTQSPEVRLSDIGFRCTGNALPGGQLARIRLDTESSTAAQ